jgi:peptidylprolyl isomerase
MSACSTEEGTAQEGDTVRVDYTGTLDDGTVFDSSIDPSFGHVEPLEFTIGADRVIPGFEQAVIGLSLNESTTVHIPAEEAYGPLEVVFDLDRFSPDNQPEVGQQGQVQLENGKVIEAIVTDISDSRVTFANTHLLAGEDLTFEIQLVEILQPS